MYLIAQSILGKVLVNPKANSEVILSSFTGLATLYSESLSLYRYDGQYEHSCWFKENVVEVFAGSASNQVTQYFAESYISPESVSSRMSPDEQHSVLRNYGERKGFLLGSRFTDKEKTQSRLCVFRSDTSEVIAAVDGLGSLGGHYVDGCLYYLKRDHIQAYDKDFKPAWRFDIPDPSFNPAGQLNDREVIAHEDSVIANFYVNPNNNYAGSVYCWAKDDGVVRWHCDFDVPVQDLRRYNDTQLLAVVGGKLCLINAETGQVDAEYETGLLHDFDRKAVHFYGDIICLYGLADNKIQFYQRDTFELLREVDCTPFDFKFYKFSSIQHDHLLFIPCLQNSHKYWQFCGSMLMIDLTDIHAELTIEQGPEFDIELPSKDNGAIRLSVNHNDWGDIVRFAERHFAGLVYEHGKNWLNPKHNKHFNGHLELTVKGCDAPELTEKLGVFEKRMLKIIEDDELHDKPITVKWVVE